MNFEDPVWLYLAPLVAIATAGLLAYGMRQREALLARFAAQRLLENLTEKADLKRNLIKSALVVLGLAAVALSIARPQYGVEWSERKARGLDIVFVLDSSKSMLATDLRPNRLTRAKLAILDLVERLESDRIGLVAFAGQAFLQTPPTLDYAAFRESLESVDPQVMTRGGSDLGRALQEAAKAFPVENNYKVVVLLTDGEDLQGGALEAVRQADDNGIKVYAIGIGTPEGEYLKIKNEQGQDEFVRDSAGQPVRSQLDENTLQEIARLTGGSYSRLSNESLEALYRSVISTLPRSERESEMQEVRIERFQWVLSVACLFLVMDVLIRRRKVSQPVSVIAIGILLYGFIASPTLQAQSVAPESDLIEEVLPLELPDADEVILDDEQPPTRTATDLYNEGHALILEQNFEAAKEQYDTAMLAPEANLKVQRDAAYNAAHSSFQLGESAFQAQDFETTIEHWKESEASFRAAHEIDPKDLQALKDAELVEARRKALEEFLKQQEQQQDQQQENQEDQQQDQSEDSEEQQDSGESGERGEQDQDSESGDSGESGESQSDSENEGQNEDQSESQDNSESGENDSESSQQGNSQEDQAAPEESQPKGQSPSEDPTSEEESQPLPEQGEEEDRGSEQQAPSTQSGDPAEDNSDAAGASAAAPTTATIEGMTEQEARELLDSMQNNERLLPFVEEAEPRNRQMQDW